MRDVGRLSYAQEPYSGVKRDQANMVRKQAQIPIRLTAVRVRQLQLFALAAEVGSISEAARRAHVTQPTATEMLQELERAFSLQLYVRGSKGIVLTEQGKRVAARAASALRELQWAVSEASSASIVREVLRVGYVPPAIYGGLPRAVQSFAAAQPDVLVNLRELSVADSVVALQGGEIDIALTVNHASFTPAEGMEGIRLEALAVECYRVFVSKLAPFPAEPVTAEAMRQLPWILPVEGSYTRNMLEDWFFRQGVAPPESFIEVSPLTAAIELLRSMPYAALLPDVLARSTEFPHLAPLPGETFTLPIRLMLACKQSQASRPAVESFIQHVVKFCGLEMSDAASES
jgi:DNA-binding transcriptional LysR family regulator